MILIQKNFKVNKNILSFDSTPQGLLPLSSLFVSDPKRKWHSHTRIAWVTFLPHPRTPSKLKPDPLAYAINQTAPTLYIRASAFCGLCGIFLLSIDAARRVAHHQEHKLRRRNIMRVRIYIIGSRAPTIWLCCDRKEGEIYKL